MKPDFHASQENPFSSRYVRPGALPFLFPSGDSIDGVVSRFEAAGRRGAVVGPHGSGKSTLIEQWLAAMRLRGPEPRVFVLRQGDRRLAPGFDAGLEPADVVVVDGYEQLGGLGRARLRRAVRRTGCGLLASAHRPIRSLPTIVATRTTANSALALAAQLLRNASSTRIGETDILEAFEKHRGNLREVFFTLYELYELRR